MAVTNKGKSKPITCGTQPCHHSREALAEPQNDPERFVLPPGAERQDHRGLASPQQPAKQSCPLRPAYVPE
ncbi:hypothetical protein NDU88_005355 [Pleurodeles waltl]|uniref:Uncharacterized protein n=1 Tax=Pleurodeles waltl TaxID=8319 RepID=A0AAV7TVA4_PLEWA|nr:hypothetical protein NDU88_005355 [Pleurodeles waltl]